MAPLIGTIKIAIMAGLFLMAGQFLFNPVASTPLPDLPTGDNSLASNLANNNNKNNKDKNKHNQPQKTDSTSYGLIIDAGSSGSRLLAFHWETIRPREGNITVLPLMDEKGKQYKEKVRPGLSAQTPESVAEHLAPLINKAKKIIPKEKHESTPIFLKATAGMRLVPMAERKRLIDAVSAYFSDKTRVPFSFDSANNAQVIPGEDEGAFGWISVNTLLGNLKSSDARNTVAALDLGGASTQITFRPTTTSLENSYNIWLNSRKYDLYTHSYLRLGVNEARSRYIAALMAKRGGNNGNAMNDPCMYRDLTQDYPLHSGNTVKLVGQGQFDACYQAVKSTLLGRNTFCATEPCAINGVHQPDIPEGMPIYATSNYNDVAVVVNCTGKSSPGCIYKSAKQQCDNLKASEVKGPFSGNVTPENSCFAAALVVALTVDAYRIPMDREVYFTDELPAGHLDWAFGAMINSVNTMKIIIDSK